jgi:hypothetical protein
VQHEDVRRLDDGDREVRVAALAVEDSVADGEMLELRDDAIGAVRANAEQRAVQPVRHVPAGAVGGEPHLDQPWPHGLRRGVDGRGARGFPHRGGDEIVAGHGLALLGRDHGRRCGEEG